MAWVKMKNRNGVVLDVPESVYESMFKGNGAYSLLEEPKPAPKVSDEKPTDKVEKIESETNQENKEEEIVEDEQIRKPNNNENNNTRKGSKKVNS